MNWSPPPRCGKAAEAPLKNAPLQQLFHNVLIEIEIHLSLLYALNRSNSKTVPNFVGRRITTFEDQGVGECRYHYYNDCQGEHGESLHFLKPPVHVTDTNRLTSDYRLAPATCNSSYCAAISKRTPSLSRLLPSHRVHARLKPSVLVN
jgi:hypothetical protein